MSPKPLNKKKVINIPAQINAINFIIVSNAIAATNPSCFSVASTDRVPNNIMKNAKTIEI